MKYRLIYAAVLVVAVVSRTGPARAFETFRLVADTAAHDQVPQHHAPQHDHGALQHNPVLRDATQHDLGTIQHDVVKPYHGAMQHEAIEYRPIPHGATQHGGADQKWAAPQDCEMTQKGCGAPKCGIIQKLGWSDHLGVAQKGCAAPKGGCKGGCTPPICHLQAACVRIQCAAMNLQCRVKEHCDTLKARLCWPKCSCASKCSCGGKYDAVDYGATKYEGQAYDIIIDDKMDFEQ
jgi:hypothetical protein